LCDHPEISKGRCQTPATHAHTIVGTGPARWTKSRYRYGDTIHPHMHALGYDGCDTRCEEITGLQWALFI